MVAVGAMGLVGCEEKKPDAAKAVGGMMDAAKDAAGKAADSAKATADKAAAAAKDAGAAATDKAKDLGTKASAAASDAAKAVSDKAKEASDAMKDKAIAGVKSMVDAAQEKIKAMTAAGAKLPAEKQPEFGKAMTGINEQFASFTKSFDGLKSLSGDGLMAKVKDMTGMGDGLMKTISETAAKFGLKI